MGTDAVTTDADGADPVSTAAEAVLGGCCAVACVVGACVVG